ncbi:hypothetical protein D9M68_529120 [compost metagenome]
MVEVVRELGARLLLAVDDPGPQEGGTFHVVAQAAEQIGVFGHAFGDDVAGAIKRRLHIHHLGGQEGRCAIGRRDGAIGKDRFGQRPEATLAGDLSLGAALRLVGQIDVFEFRLGFDGGDLGFQFVRQLVLPADRLQDRCPTRLEFAQVSQPLRQHTQLRIVEPAGHFLAVARDERHRCPLVQQLDSGFNLRRCCLDFAGNNGGDGFSGVGHGNSVFPAALGSPARFVLGSEMIRGNRQSFGRRP